MSPHFAAYSFVDRITAFVPAKHARGTFAVPRTVPDFSSCLVAEAVGQLAAWVSMAHIDFRGRPVAALATETRFHRDAAPGDGFSWGRFGPRTEVRRHGHTRLFAMAPPEKRQRRGLFRR